MSPISEPGIIDAPLREELRIYAVLRDDLPFTPAKYVALAAGGYMALAGMVAADPALARDYDIEHQPKLVKRAKNEGRLTKAVAALETAGIAHVRVSMDDTLCGVFLPPMTRSELPADVEALQLFENPRARYTSDNWSHAITSSNGSEDTVASIMVDGSLAAPLGKMMAQAGHGVWATVTAGGVPAVLHVAFPDKHCEFSELHYRVSDGRIGDVAGGLIVDMGRTVFGGPTETCVWACADLSPRSLKESLQVDYTSVPAKPAGIPVP